MEKTTQQTLKNITQLLKELGDELDWLSENLSSSESKILYNKVSRQPIDTEKKVSMLLHELNIPVSISGYKYIAFSINWLVQQDALLGLSITKELYPEVAKHFNKTATQVERGIRHAIQHHIATSFKLNINKPLINKLFPLYNGNSVIKNSTFLLRLTEYIQKGY